MSFVFFKVSGHCFLTFVSVDELKQNTSGNKQVEFENKSIRSLGRFKV